MMATPLLSEGPEDGPQVVLAHGAGAPMDSPFMECQAAALAAAGLRVTRFEFPYMRKRREDGRRRPPDRQETLLDCWREVLQLLPRSPAAPLALGGKSLGGRMASLLADEVEADALLCLGYPFHPVGRPERLRLEHLQSLRTPALILQGERDALGARHEVQGYVDAGLLSPAICLHWLSDGDHSFKPRKKSGRSERQNWAEAAGAAVDFLLPLLGEPASGG